MTLLFCVIIDDTGQERNLFLVMEPRAIEVNEVRTELAKAQAAELRRLQKRVATAEQALASPSKPPNQKQQNISFFTSWSVSC